MSNSSKQNYVKQNEAHNSREAKTQVNKNKKTIEIKTKLSLWMEDEKRSSVQSVLDNTN